MKFTATSLFTAIAKGAAKYSQWKVYIKKTTDLSEALNSGTWVEVTSYLKPVDSVPTSLEVESGQFTADSMNFTGVGIAWWKANVFNASASQYIEIKIEEKLGMSESNLASDTVYQFDGIVDKRYTPNEVDDTLTFSAYSLDEAMSRFAAENITTQRIDAGTGGLILQSVAGIYVTDANVASYVLKAGVHTLTYEYNGGSQQIKLDDGAFVGSLTPGSHTLVNGDGDQKLTVTVSGSLGSTDATEKIVVVTEGTTVPSQFYEKMSTRRLISKCFAKVGINTVNFGTLNCATFDAASAISFLGQPPDDETVTGNKYAITSDGTNLYLGIAHKLYKYDPATYTYTLKATTDSGYDITRLWYNSRNDQIWILEASGTTYKVRTYTIGSDTLSSVYATLSSGASGVESFTLMDFNYSGGSYKYGLCYVDDTNFATRFVDSGGDALAINQAGMGYGTIYGASRGLGYIYTAGGSVGYYGFHVYHTTPAYTTAYQHVDGTGNWVFDATQLGPNYQVLVGSYDPDEDKIYYWDSTALKVKSHAVNSASTTDVLTLASGDSITNMYFANSKTYLTTFTNGYLYSAESSAATKLSRSVDPERTYTKNQQLVYVDRLYGIDEYGTLFQYYTKIEPFVGYADGTGISVRDLLLQAVNAANLVYSVSHAKSARVLRRSDDAGALVTSGDSVTLTTDLSSNITEHIKGYEGMQLVSCTNDTRTRTYNGSGFDSQVLSDKRQLSISNSLMPTSKLRDLAKFFWQFYGSDHKLYRIPMDGLMLHQYEVLDGVTLSFSSTRITSSSSGVIYGVTYTKTGMELFVLI